MVSSQCSASQIGSFHQRQSDSHACSPISPATGTKTQCSQVLFQQPPSRPCLPFFSSPTTDSNLSQHYWQTSCQSLYKQEQYDEPAHHSEYDVFEGFKRPGNAEGSAKFSQAFCLSPARQDSDPLSELKHEDNNFLAPLSQQSRALYGIFDQPTSLISEEYLQATSFQRYPSTSVGVTEASIVSSSCPSTSSMAKSRISAIGSYCQFSFLDTSVDAGDLAQHDVMPLSSSRSTPGESTRHTVSNNSENDADGNIGPVRLRKQHIAKGRERVHIALAPDQPPTTQGKQRERVYVACQQCRSRKIRCDGAKPMCYNCNQRGTGVCEFDSIPKRRGPDRQPGARQRHGNLPGPRRRRTRNDKEEALIDPQGGMPYLNTQASSEPIAARPNDQNNTWARIPSPTSSSSSNDYRYGHDHIAPGSSGSNTSQAVHDYRSLLTPSFAYNAPQGGYASAALRPEPDLRMFVPRISTDPVAPHYTAGLSGTISPETPLSFPYSSASPVTTQTVPYTSVPPALKNNATCAVFDNVSKVDSSIASNSLGFGDYVTRALDLVQPPAVDQEPDLPSAYAGIETLSSQRIGHADFATVPDARTMLARRDSFGNVTSEPYNPYQWAIHQGQDSSGVQLSVSEDDDSVIPYEFAISQAPSLDFVRKTWWDSLLDTYCAEVYCTPSIVARYQMAYGLSVSVPNGMPVTGATRQAVAQIIVYDLQSIFRDSIFWFSFFNVPLFFGTFFRTRETMQPALVLALLMWANYLRSSMLDLGTEGMRRTIWLKEKAHAALDASVNASWIDPGLAQAAWLIALFELSSHPSRSVSRLHSALGTLDNIIHALALTFIDAQDPLISATSGSTSFQFRSSTLTNASVSHLLPVPLYNRQPIAGVRPKFKYSSQLLQYHSPTRNVIQMRGDRVTEQPSLGEATCICNDLTLGKNWPESKDHVPLWSFSPAWKPTWTDAEIRREECRRLCWNTLHLFAGYTTYRTSLGLTTLDLFLLHPSNVLNIFPGENLTDLVPLPPSVSKLDTVWALYARAILLWHACLRIRNVSERERAIFAQSVWLEADAIENALDGHSCGTERAFLYHGREYLFNARMYVSSEFRRFVPHPSPEMSGAVHRRKAEEWLTHQATLAKRIMHGLQALTGLRGTMLAKRPFFCFWFMGHMSRCMQLWQADKTLTVALELAKNFLCPINYLSALWPCEDQRMQYAYMRKNLEDACREAGLELPPPVDPFSLPQNTNSLP